MIDNEQHPDLEKVLVQILNEEIALELLRDSAPDFDEKFKTEVFSFLDKTTGNPWDIPAIVKILKMDNGEMLRDAIEYQAACDSVYQEDHKRLRE